MKAEIINLTNPNSMVVSGHQTVLSLGRFCRFLESRIDAESGAKKQFFKDILKKIRQFPELEKELSLEAMIQHKETLEYIYLTLTAPVTDEKEKFWALSVPLSPIIFYGTKALYHFLTDREGTLKGSIVGSMDKEEKIHNIESIVYTLALQRLYGFDLSTKLEIIQNLSAGRNAIEHTYKIQMDTRFVEVSYLGDELPAIDFSIVELHENQISSQSIERLQELLPITLLRFEGFSIVQISDVTVHKAIENIKNIVVNLTPDKMVYDEVGESIKLLIGSPSTYIRLIPMLKVNDKLVIDDFGTVGKKLREICKVNNVGEKVYLDSVERFFHHPHTVLDEQVRMENSNPENIEMYRMLVNMGVQGLLIQPIYFNKQLVGILEVFSKEPKIISSATLTALDPIIPLLEQLFQTNIDDFKVSLDKVVKDKFTSLQPSVQWAFSEAAWQYLQVKKLDKKAQIGRIRFEDVYPLYGAIDVRNSSLERNSALQADLRKQLSLLVGLLEELKKVHFLTLIDEMIFNAKRMLNRIGSQFGADDEFQINQFLESDIVAFLLHYHQSYPASEPLINEYYLAAGPGGFAYTNRDDLEQSLRLLNATIGSLLDRMNDEIQQEYPCFFEKFRSDGIEYDIYIGQSITPKRPFDPMYLRNLRLWQLTSMALVARLTRALIPQMKKRLETTQLIFIHAATIDIEFRSDEHRFDVEGAYNIRYEMIKKRIDKVHLKDSEERLTMPGKIALIYFQGKDIEEYLGYIHYLQEQKVLNMDLEYLELEELQGVVGLKALRIGVNMETEDFES